MPRKKKPEEAPEKTESSELDSQQNYVQMIEDLKRQIQESQLRAEIAANKELTRTYWTIGRAISEREKQGVSGENIIEKMSQDFIAAYSGLISFSQQNLFYMKRFYECYPDGEITKLPVAQIPWRYNKVLLKKLGNPTEILWYAVQALEGGWGESTLETLIDNDFYNYQTKKTKTSKKQ